jgi:hypothetical protein
MDAIRARERSLFVLELEAAAPRREIERLETERLEAERLETQGKPRQFLPPNSSTDSMPVRWELPAWTPQ